MGAHTSVSGIALVNVSHLFWQGICPMKILPGQFVVVCFSAGNWGGIINLQRLTCTCLATSKQREWHNTQCCQGATRKKNITKAYLLQSLILSFQGVPTPRCVDCLHVTLWQSRVKYLVFHSGKTGHSEIQHKAVQLTMKLENWSESTTLVPKRTEENVLVCILKNSTMYCLW